LIPRTCLSRISGVSIWVTGAGRTR
jgi:hypothetical protein